MPGGRNLVVGNIHTISGSKMVPGENHIIPGRPRQATRFKQLCFTNAFRRMVEKFPPQEPPLSGTPAASLGEKTQTIYVVGGDMNLIGDPFLQSLPTDLNEIMTDSIGQLCCICARKLETPTEARDWIVANAVLEAVSCNPPGPRLAWDKAHAALIVRFSRKSCEVPVMPPAQRFPSPGPRRGPGAQVARQHESRMRVALWRRSILSVMAINREQRAEKDRAREDAQAVLGRCSLMMGGGAHSREWVSAPR